MKENIKENILTICMIIVGIFIAILTLVMIDFYNDYKCSTTDNINWYMKHQCYRYNR